MKAETKAVRVTVNGTEYAREVEMRSLLSDFLRQDLGLTGTHVGCEQGVCGACTVLLDGDPIRSCLLLTVQVDNHAVRTVESLAADRALNPVQEAFRTHHGLQCGFCTPGILMSLVAAAESGTSDEAIGELVAGHLCRCTGYVNIRAAARDALTAMEKR